MTEPRHIAQEDLVLYAMHALTLDEAAVIESQLSASPTTREELAAIRGDLALLAFSVEQQPAPSGSQERLMARIGAGGAVQHADKATPGSPTARVLNFEDAGMQHPVAKRRSLWPVLVPWAAAAALTVACVSLGVENRKLSETANAEASLITNLSSKGSHAQQIVDALNSPHAQRVTLTSTKQPPEPTGHAIYLADRGSLLFQADNLRQLEATQTYELWVIPANGTAPVPAGTFRPDASGYASVVLPQLPAGIAAKAFGVTIEKLGGSTTPTVPIVLAGAAS